MKSPASMPAVSFKKEAKVLNQPIGNLKTNNLSIQEMLTKKKSANGENEEVQSLVDRPSTPFSLDDLKKAWRMYAFKAKKEGLEALYVGMTTSEPKLLPEFRIHQLIDNRVQNEYFKMNEMKILEFLRSELKNWSISLTYEEAKVGENGKKLLSGKDKFDEMAKRNPNLITMQKLFKLDIEF